VVGSFIYTVGVITGPLIAKLREFDSIWFLRVHPAP
jgi:hypothetical protein